MSALMPTLQTRDGGIERLFALRAFCKVSVPRFKPHQTDRKTLTTFIMSLKKSGPLKSAFATSLLGYLSSRGVCAWRGLFAARRKKVCLTPLVDHCFLGSQRPLNTEMRNRVHLLLASRDLCWVVWFQVLLSKEGTF